MASWGGGGQVEIRGKCSIAAGVKIGCGKNAKLILGDGLSVNVNTEIICAKKISFGKDVIVSWECLIMDSDFHKIIEDQQVKPREQDIAIGNHVWIGCRSTILKGSNIKDNSVVAACSTISKCYLDENQLLGGTNKILKTNINWEH